MPNAFEIRNLTKTYPGFQLGPLDLDLEPGAVLGYIGPNGSGKTTTLHAMVGLVRSDGGEIDVFGRRNDPEDPVWKSDIGYVGDAHVFYEGWSCARNLKFLSQVYPNWSDKLAGDLAGRLEVPLHKKARELSGGNRVKLALVSALAHSPRLLLLDEPTVGLDPLVRSEVLDVLFEALETGERAIFYSTHILSDIGRLADDLAFLSNGRIVLRAAKDNLADRWRRISFQLPTPQVALQAVVNQKAEGKDYLVVSSDHEVTLQQLGELGARHIQVARMGIDEIAVEILKGARHVAAS